MGLFDCTRCGDFLEGDWGMFEDKPYHGHCIPTEAPPKVPVCDWPDAARSAGWISPDAHRRAVEEATEAGVRALLHITWLHYRVDNRRCGCGFKCATDASAEQGNQAWEAHVTELAIDRAARVRAQGAKKEAGK